MNITKSITHFLTFIALSISLLSCSPSPSVVQTAIAQTEVFDSQIQTAIAKTQSIMSHEQEMIQISTPTEGLLPTPTFTPTPTLEPVPTEIPTEKPTAIRLNQSITVRNHCEFKVTDINFSKRILPPNTSGFYTYYETQSSDSTFLDIVLSIKNLDSIITSAEDFVYVTAFYDNQFTYSSTAVLVGPDGSFNMGFYGIEPLLTGVVHHIIEVPNQVQTGSKPLVIIFRVSDQEYQYKYR